MLLLLRAVPSPTPITDPLPLSSLWPFPELPPRSLLAFPCKTGQRAPGGVVSHLDTAPAPHSPPAWRELPACGQGASSGRQEGANTAVAMFVLQQALLLSLTQRACVCVCVCGICTLISVH